MRIMELNSSQQIAFDLVGKFLISSERVLTITGGAGTGKSYLIDALYKEYKNITLTATTREAASVIGGRTIHSYLGFALGCERVNPGRLQPHHVILIDESSMLKACMMKYLLSSTNNKIILVGDANQLTVGITVNLMDYPFVLLTENMRAKSEHLVKLVEHLDDCVEKQEYPNMKAHIGSHLVFIENHKKFLNLMNNEEDEYLLVAYQNRIVDRYKEEGFEALTSHKAQGKSYPIVYIDARDLISSHIKPKNKFNNPLDKNTYLRLLSVSVSRAQYQVVCFTGETRWN